MRYEEDFNDGPGGWAKTVDNFQPPAPLPVRDGALWCWGPWWVDYNHAPPGGGYLQLLACLYMRGPIPETLREVDGGNRFVDGNYPTNFTNARVHIRCKGEVELAGGQACLLIQGRADARVSGWVLSGQPIKIEKDYTETTLDLVPDRKQWTSMGARWNRGETYAERPLETILADVNVNIYLVFFGFHPKPMGPITDDQHKLRAGKDYPVWPSSIAQGYAAIDRVAIDFAETTK